MKTLIITALIAVLVVLFPLRANAQGGGEYLDLSKDQFVPGGLTGEGISKELLPAFAGYAPKESSQECIVLAFNYDIPKLQVAFKKASGTIYTKAEPLRKGEKLVATINSRRNLGDCWEVKAVPRWLVACGNPLPYPVEITFWIPKWGEKEVIIQRVEIPKPYAVTVKEGIVIQQLVPSLRDIELVLPPTEKGKYSLVVTGHEEAGRRWVYEKDFWDKFLDFLRVVAMPIGQILRRADNIKITANGGSGYGAAAAAAAASSSSSSTAVTPTSGAGTSGSGGAGAGGAAGGGGGGETYRFAI